MPNSIQLELRAASLAPTTFNAEDNTVEVVLSTGADVQRGGYIERLPVANADLRDIEGKPVLDAHNQGSTRAVLGIIEKAWRKDGEIRARLKLSAREDVAGIVGDRPRRAGVGSTARRSVATASRITCPMAERSRRADSSLPLVSTFWMTPRISPAVMSAMGRARRSFASTR